MGRTRALDDALPATGRLRVLDGLRFVAAVAVVLFHFTGRDSIAWPEGVREVFPFLSRITVYGGFGPYLFFMISGFVVLMSAWGRPVHSFVASRVGRLYPAYWAAVLLTAAVLFLNQGLIDRWGSLGPSGVAMNLTMFQSAFGVPHVDGVFWTLWVELKFYVLLALLAMAGITQGRLLALCLVWPVAGALAAQAGSPLLVAALEPVYAPFFCIGILLYLVHREGWSVSTGLLLALNYCFALYTCSSYFVPWTLGVAGSGISFRGTAVLLTLSILAIGLATLTRLDRLDWRWLTFLGALTYPLYLVHQVPGWVLIHRVAPVLPAYVTVGLVLVVVLAAAYLVHRFVERPVGGRLRRAVERDLARNGARTPRSRHDAAVPSSRAVPPLPVARVPDGSVAGHAAHRETASA
ncbi:MAG TPA: acyltransferase [Blastococcus sp.]|jgi:peptidoglycan/LPS O-acetylase OafA/YrhL|nr:acyltransferase [Blastococcus sp.]